MFESGKECKPKSPGEEHSQPGEPELRDGAEVFHKKSNWSRDCTQSTCIVVRMSILTVFNTGADAGDIWNAAQGISPEKKSIL